MTNPSIAFFISAHGFGHAARAAGIMQALFELRPDLSFEIFSAVPSWFFEESLECKFRQHYLECDVGLVQRSALQEDLPATLSRLEGFYPPEQRRLDSVASTLQRLGCALAISDISPFGILAARGAGVRSVLVENFTWDWIYEGYLDLEPGFARHIDYLEEIFASADQHVLTEPVCNRAPCDLTVPPVSRSVRSGRAPIRERLGIGAHARMVLLTMGGIPDQYPFTEKLLSMKSTLFVMPGSHAPGRRENLLFLPHRSGFYHPDLIEASDAVIGKLGYSTLAEVYQSGVPFLFVKRERFRETPPLSRFALSELRAAGIDEQAFAGGEWLSVLEDLLAKGRVSGDRENGARRVAEFVSELV